MSIRKCAASHENSGAEVRHPTLSFVVFCFQMRLSWTKIPAPS